jgi:hypothetical protein
VLVIQLLLVMLVLWVELLPIKLMAPEQLMKLLMKMLLLLPAGQNANDSVVGGGSPKIETHAPTTEWDEQSYSAYRGFPAAVAFHENRLWFGGTIAQPDGIWASKSLQAILTLMLVMVKTMMRLI